MKLLCALLLSLVCVGCSKPMTAGQVNSVIQACTDAGMQFQVKQNYVMCYTKDQDD